MGGKEYAFLKKKNIPGIIDCGDRVITCIACIEEPSPEDIVSPLCRDVHYVICKECMERLQEKETAVECLFCKKKKSDNKAFQEEILGGFLSLMPHQTLHSLELRPDMEVENAMRLPRETKVILNSVSLSGALFFKLMTSTAVEIKNKITIFGQDNSLDRCCGVLDVRTNEQTKIFVGWWSEEETEKAYSNIKTIRGKSIHIDTEEIHAAEDGVYFLLKNWALFDGYSPLFFLESSEREHIRKIPSRLESHGENETEKLGLSAGEIGEIQGTERNNIPLWKVKELKLTGCALEILHKLRFHEENEMDVFWLCAGEAEEISGILRMENSGIWVGKVKKLGLRGYAVGILPKLRIHEENEMEELGLTTQDSEDIQILGMENSSIWVGKVKRLELIGHAVKVFTMLGFHQDSEVKKLVLITDEREKDVLLNHYYSYIIPTSCPCHHHGALALS
ncbi:MAG: uncharacterized protein A8A55_2985, partial [Amphiamblys sp. WSBS2006]